MTPVTEKPKGPEDESCPLYRQPCSEVCQGCSWWMPVRSHGKDGKTTQLGFDCAQKIAAWGALKTAREVRQTCATVDKVKNGVHKMHSNMAETNMKLIEGLKPALQTMIGAPAMRPPETLEDLSGE